MATNKVNVDTGSAADRESEAVRGLLENRARTLASLPTEDEVAADTLNLMVFQLAGERYGVAIDLVREVQPLKAGSWSRVPCTPQFIVGAVNIRGQIHSVMDLASFFGQPRPQLPRSAHVLLVRSRSADDEGEMELCILAEELPEVQVLSRAEVLPAPSTIPTQAQEYVRGVTSDMLTILDLERLLKDPMIIVQEEV